MAQINASGILYRSGHSNRQIAKLLGVNREIVGKYVAEIKAAGNQNQPNLQTGSCCSQPNPQSYLPSS
jgi:transposase